MAEIYTKQHMTQLSYNDVVTTLDGGTAPGVAASDTLGDVWVDLDQTYGLRKFRFVLNNGTNTGTLANGQVAQYYDNYGSSISTSFTDGPRNCVAGVGQSNGISSGNCGWIQTEGYHPALYVDGSTFAYGKTVIIYSTAGEGTLNADGTAPPYPELGTALGSSSGSSQKVVAALLHIGKFTISP